MAKHAFFYKSENGDRKYGADDFSEWFRKFFTDGVFNGELQVKANNDMTVTVAGGTGQIGGKSKVFDPEIIKLDTANGSYDRIVLRRDDTRRDFYLIKVTGAPSSSPKAPELVRSGNIYDLKLCEIRVPKGVIKITQANVKDTRPDPKECGWITGTVKEMDFSQFSAQFESYVEGFKESTLADVTAWFETIKGKLKPDVAVNLQLQIDQLNEKVVKLQKKIKYGTQLPETAEEGDIFILLEK